MRPSFLGLIASGVLIAIAVMLMFIGKPNIAEISMLLLLSIAISVHSMLHFGEEVIYRWNPLATRI